ncbi:MAG TPA: hypothetical protein VH643_23735, partial [Gemmataceae bacterium]
NALAWAPRGGYLAAAMSDGTVLALDGSTLAPLGPAFKVTATGAAETVAFRRDGATLATGADDGTVRLWSVADPARPVPLATAHDSGTYVYTVAWAPDGKTLAAASTDNVTRLWNVASPAAPAPEGRALTGLRKYAIGLAFSPDSALLAVGSADGTVHLWNVRDPRRATPASAPLTGPASYVWALAFAPDGKTLAVAYAEHRSGVVELWDVAARKVRRRFVTQGGGGRLAFAPDGKSLATGRDNDAVVRLYDVATGKEYARLQGLEWGVGGVAFSGDGRYLAAISTGAAVVLLWDAKTGQELHRFKDHKQRLWSVALSRDGKTLATGDMEGTVLVYDTASGKHIGTFADVAASLVFSRDGRTLIAGGGDGWVESWSIANLPRPKPPEAPVAQNKPLPRPLAFGKDLQAVGKVEPFLAVAVDPRAGRALFLGRDRFLRVYSYPEFKAEKAYWLGATAYRATLDRQRGMLYAAVCAVQALKMERDGRVSGPADIYIYDVKKILAGEDLSDHMLRPAAMVPVKAELTHLQATADARWIYYLDAVDWKGARLGRIDAATRKADRTTTVSDATRAFGLGRDGKTLYIGRTRRDPKAGPQQLQGEIQVFDPATMAVRGSIDVPSKPKEIAVEDELLFFGGEGPLGVVDLRPAKPAVVAHWQGPWFGGRYHVGIAPRRVYIAANSIPATIRAFDFPDNAPIPKDRPLEADSVSDDGDGRLLGELTTTPDGKYLLCRTGEILRLAQPGMNRPLPPHQQDEKPPIDPKGLPWHERPILTSPRRGFVQAVAIAPDDTMIALGEARGGVFVYERASGKPLGTAPSEAGIAYLTFAPKGKKLISTTLDRGGQIRVTGKGTSIGGAYAFFRDVAGHGLDSVTFTANARELAGAGGAQGKDVVFWNAETGRGVKSVRGFPDPLTAVALSSDGKRVAAGSTVGPVRQADLSNPRETRTMTGHTAEVRCVAYAPDGKILASGGVDTTVRLWDADTGKEVRKLRGHTNVVLCLVFSPDGKTLVTGGADGTVRVWDVATGNERGSIPARRRGAMVYALAFAPDGRTLVAACGAEVRQWEVGPD